MRSLTEAHDVEATGVAIAIDTVVAELVSALGSFQDNAEWMADEKNLERLAQMLDALGEAKDRIKAIEGDITPVIAGLMGQQQVQVGDFKLERRGGRKRTQWQSGSVFNELIARSNVSPEGEVLDAAGARERLIEAIRACFPLTASTGWRTNALRTWGIDPDEYAESSPGAWRVDVHHVTDEGGAA